MMTHFCFFKNDGILHLHQLTDLKLQLFENCLFEKYNINKFNY